MWQDTGAKLNIIELGKPPGEAFRITPQDLPQPADGAADFPVGMKVRVRCALVVQREEWRFAS